MNVETSLSRRQFADLKMLDEAIRSASPCHRVNWLTSICADTLTGDELESLGNRLGRQGHLKNRQAPGKG